MKYIFAILSMFLALTACEIGTANGYVPTDEEIKEIQVGVDTKDTILEKFGEPAFIGENGSIWYYVAQFRSAKGPLPNSEVRRRVLTIVFGASDRVASVDVSGLENAKDVPVSNETTETEGRKLSLWDQLIGNLGNFSAEQLLGGVE